jgi:putative membrane protein
LAILLLIKWNPWYFLMLLYIPITAGQAYLFRRNFRLYIAADALQIDSGIWGRKTQIVRWYKTQQVTVQQSIYQRQHGLATLQVSTAGGTISIPFIPLELARQLHDYALYEIERSDRSWM